MPYVITEPWIGTCEPDCPVEAIFIDTHVPSEWTSYIAKNRSLSGEG